MSVSARLGPLFVVSILLVFAALTHAATQAPPDLDRQAAFEWKKFRDPATGEIPAGIRERELEFARGLPQRVSSLAEEAAEGRSAKIAPWLRRGPHDLGGRTRALAFDVADPTHQTMFAGATSGGIWRTTDGGDSWTKTTAPDQLHSVTDIAQDTRAGHEATWYHSTGELRGNNASEAFGIFRGDGIFKSTDGGLSWTLLPSTSTGQVEFDNPFDYTWKVAVDASNAIEDEVYAASYYGIHRSVDGGTTWDLVLGDLGVAAAYTDVEVSPSGVVYAGIRTEGPVHGLFRSEDGLNWTNITPPGVNSNWLITTAIAPSDENIVYALVTGMNTRFAHGFFKYDESTGIWENRSSALLNLPPYGWDYSSTTGYAQVVAVKPDDPDVVFLGGLNLTRSTNGFADSSQRTRIGGWNYGYTDHELWTHAMIFDPGNPLVAFTATDGGIHRTNGVTFASVFWTSLDNDYYTAMPWFVAIDPNESGSDVAIAGFPSLGTFLGYDTDPQRRWQRIHISNGLVPAVGRKTLNNQTFVVGWDGGDLRRYRFDFSGTLVNTTRIDPDPGVGSIGYLYANPYVLSPTSISKMFVASDAGIWRNFDIDAIPPGNSSPTTQGYSRIGLNAIGWNISALALSREPNPTLWFGTENGLLYRLDDAHTAPSFSMGTGPLGAGFDGGYTIGISVNPDVPQNVMVGFSNHGIPSLYYTSDGGTSWTDVEGNLAGVNGPSIRDVSILPYGGQTFYFAATSTGLYSTAELNGSSTVWALEAPNLIGNVVVDDLASRPIDGRLVAATHGAGVFELRLDQIVAAPSLTPGTQLQRGAPNPFNPSTQLSFELSHDGHAELTVFDAAGRRVRTLVDRELPAGPHTYTWNGRNDDGIGVASGVYRVRLTHEGQQYGRSVTLLK